MRARDWSLLKEREIVFKERCLNCRGEWRRSQRSRVGRQAGRLLSCHAGKEVVVVWQDTMVGKEVLKVKFSKQCLCVCVCATGGPRVEVEPVRHRPGTSIMGSITEPVFTKPITRSRVWRPLACISIYQPHKYSYSTIK